jgi:hypothetical protein
MTNSEDPQQQQPAPDQFQQPNPQNQYAVPPQQAAVPKGLAITALVVGIVAFISGWVPIWGALAGIVAVVFGILALRRKQSKGMSITGLALGAVAFLTSIVMTITFAVVGTSLINQINEGPTSNGSSESLGLGEKTGKEGAVQRLKEYLHYGVSEKEVTESLKNDDYTEDEIDYALEKVDPDWREQAAKSAKSYLDGSPMSKDGLIHQLEFAEFSEEDAKAGVEDLNVNWNKQAVKAAKEFMKNQDYSREDLVNTLTSGADFTDDEAEYAADKVGL